MAPFDRSYKTFYWSAIVTIVLSCTIFELFDVEKYRELEIWLLVSAGHSNCMVRLESLGTVSYSPSVVTTSMSVSLTVYNIFSVKV